MALRPPQALPAQHRAAPLASPETTSAPTSCPCPSCRTPPTLVQGSTFGIPGVEEHTHFLRQASDSVAIRNDLIANWNRANIPGRSQVGRREAGGGLEGAPVCCQSKPLCVGAGVPVASTHWVCCCLAQHSAPVTHTFCLLPPYALPAVQLEGARLLHVVVVGGGPTGVEFAGELADFVNRDLMKIDPERARNTRVRCVRGGQA